MAITVAFYGLTLEKVCEQAGNDVNWLTGTVKVPLVTDAYAVNRDTDAFWSTPQAAEIGSGNGYTTGGETLPATKTIEFQTASDQVVFDGGDVTWTFTASKTFHYSPIYIDTAGAASADPLFALLTWDSNQTVSTTYTLQWDSAGILYIDTT